MIALLLGLLAGLLVPLQAGINSQLAIWLGSPFRAAVVNNAVGLAALVPLAVVFARGRPLGGKLGEAPWWVWVGGLCGAYFVAATAYIAPTLGALTLLGVVLGGQAVASILIDKWGLVGFEQQAISPGRLAGVALLVAGIVMVRVL